MIHALALVVAALSAQCPPEDTIATARLYRVAPGDRLTFHHTSDCRDASCGERAYVVPGDRVVVYARANGRSCAMFGATRETIGWLDSGRLVPDVAAAQPAPSAWLGDWYDGDDHIRLRSTAAGRLHIKGDAYWPSAHPVENPGGGLPNFGVLDGSLTPRGDRAAYREGGAPDGCRATLRLLGDYLLVSDNGDCGGDNVRFSGTYRRRPAHRPATRS